eukprot:418516-Rhodomonas_salina.1
MPCKVAHVRRIARRMTDMDVLFGQAAQVCTGLLLAFVLACCLRLYWALAYGPNADAFGPHRNTNGPNADAC